MERSIFLRVASVVAGVLCASPLGAQDGTLRDEAVRAMKQAASYYHGKVASHGGYVYYYSLGLEQR